MEPVLSVTIGAVIAVILTNLVWYRTLRNVGGRQQRAELVGQLQGLKAQLVGQHLALVEAVRPVLAAREGEPSTPIGIIDRMVRGFRDQETENRQLRAQLSSASRRVAQLKRELAQHRQGDGTDAMRAHLAEVSGERDALRVKIADLTQRLKKANPTTHDALHAARQEIDQLRAQLRGANQAILALEVAPMGPPSLPHGHVRVELEDEPTAPSRVDVSRPPVAYDHLGEEWR